MGKIRLDREEAELLHFYEAGELRTIEGWETEAQRYEEVARATFKKDRRVNIRISSRDLEQIQKRALEEGIPYQTLIASILHKYVSAGWLSVVRLQGKGPGSSGRWAKWQKPNRKSTIAFHS